MKKEKKVKMFSEEEVINAYQAVYRRNIRAIEKHVKSPEEKQIRSAQVLVTLAAMRHELGLDKSN